MKNAKFGIVDDLKEEHKNRLARAEAGLGADKKRWGAARCDYSADLVLFQKWAYRVGKGWYGFDVGHIPPVWVDIIDEFFGWLETACPDFEIRQVKMKAGGLRLYVGTRTKRLIPDERIRAEISKLEHLLVTPQYLKTERGVERARSAAPKKQRKSLSK